MKSRTMLCKFSQRTVNSSFWGGKESESKNHWFWLFQKPQRTGGVFLKEPVSTCGCMGSDLIKFPNL